MFKLYNGCPNRELQAYWDSIDNAKRLWDKRVKELLGEGTRGFITYFPVEGKYGATIVQDHKYTFMSNYELFSTVEHCVSMAITDLNQRSGVTP